MEKLFYVLAMIATVLFLLQFIASLFGAEFDFDEGSDGGSGDLSDFGNYFTLRNIIMFIMGFSWTAYLFEPKLITPILFLASIIVGIIFMFINISIYKMMNRMNEDNTHSIENAIGLEALVTIATCKDGGKVSYRYNDMTYEALAFSDIEIGVGSVVIIDSMVSNKLKVKLKN